MPGANYDNQWLDLNLNLNELLNPVLHKDPVINLEGQFGYNTANHRPIYHNDNDILELASLGGQETLTMKTIVEPILVASSDTIGITGSAIITSSLGIRSYATASDVKLVTEKAVAQAIQNGFETFDSMRYMGAIDASANPSYPAAERGHVYKISVAGKIGGTSGITVKNGDMIICNTDASVTGAQATVGANWDIIEGNVIFPISVADGGTGLTALASGAMLYGSGSSTMSVLPAGTNNYYLKSVSGIPTWAAFPTLVTSFIALTDTPSAYTGKALQLLRVNSAATAVEFFTLPTYDNYVNWKIAATDAAGTPLTTGQTLAILGSGAISTVLAAGTTANQKITISHSTAPGYVHLPSGGAASQWIKYVSAGTGAWTTPAALSTSAGKGLIIGGSTTGSYDINAAKVIEIDFTQVAAAHSHPYDNYVSWNLQVNSDTSTAMVKDSILNLLTGVGLTIARATTEGKQTVTISLGDAPAYGVKVNNSSAIGTPGNFVVVPNTVLGRADAGFINYHFGTDAGTIAWGNHTHAQLHNRQHDMLTAADHTFAGMASGKIYRGSGTSAIAISTFTIADTFTANSLVYASTANALTALATGADRTILTSKGGVPTWSALAASQLPVGTAKYACLSYDNAGAAVTTKTYAVATHGCGTKPLVYFIEERAGDVDNYYPATVSIKVIRTAGATQGDVVVTTSAAIKGQVIFIGTM